MSGLTRFFAEHGWAAGDVGLFSDEDVARLQRHFDAVVVHEHYETGRPPMGVSKFGDQMIKVANAWLADETIADVVMDKRLASLAAEMLGADELYLWADSLYWKAPNGRGEQGQVGWHQDKQYWAASSTERMITACVALYPTGPRTGGMRFADGSHRWGLMEGSEAITMDDNARQHKRPQTPPGVEWMEVCPEMPSGGVTFHHCLTFHGSGPNLADTPRRSITIHMVSGEGRLVGPLPEIYDLAPGDPLRGSLFPRLFP